MLYGFVQVIARMAIRLYCRDLKLNKTWPLTAEGPLLLAANHPNSFLDAIILCTLFRQPVYSLARGDAFKGKFIRSLLTALKLLPVYRVSEGVENLEENYQTFRQCREIFKRKGIVLIFSEGKCINEWHLRTLKKGTARLAISCWEDAIPVKVLPVAINYSSFEKFGKNLQVFFGECIGPEFIDPQEGSGRSIQRFNQLLHQQLSPYVFEIDRNDLPRLHQRFYVRQSAVKRIVAFLPASLGWLLHAPLYYAVKAWVKKNTNSTDHFDSMVIAILFFSYPVYLFLFTTLAFLISGSWYALLLLAVFPATAWAHVQLKRQIA
jgi:1-acyl-sn-glycerol-3-phosphate acyltransferase